MITKGNWKISKGGGAIVTNLRPERIGYSHESFESEYDYYGGYIICESISCNEDADLLVNSKKLLLILISIVNSNENKPTISFSQYIEYKKLLLEIRKSTIYLHSMTPYYIIPFLYLPFPKLLNSPPLYPHHYYFSVENNFKRNINNTNDFHNFM